MLNAAAGGREARELSTVGEAAMPELPVSEER
jgi:hypothetical protein